MPDSEGQSFDVSVLTRLRILSSYKLAVTRSQDSSGAKENIVIRFGKKPKSQLDNPIIYLDIKVKIEKESQATPGQNYESPTMLNAIYAPPTRQGLLELKIPDEQAIPLISPLLFFARVVFWNELETENATVGSILEITAPFIMTWSLPLKSSSIDIDATKHEEGIVVFSFTDRYGKKTTAVYTSKEGQKSTPVFLKKLVDKNPFPEPKGENCK